MSTKYLPIGKPLGQCLVCRGAVVVREDDALFPHMRYADGCGSGPEQCHDLVQCEGGGR